MCVLLYDPFFQTKAAILGMTYREIWEWVVRGPYEESKKNADEPARDVAETPEEMAARVSALFGVDPKLVEGAIKETEAQKGS